MKVGGVQSPFPSILNSHFDLFIWLKLGLNNNSSTGNSQTMALFAHVAPPPYLQNFTNNSYNRTFKFMLFLHHQLKYAEP